MRRCRGTIQTPTNSSDRHDPRQEVAQEGALDLAGEADVVLLQLLGEVRVDPRGDELLLAAGQRLLRACPG